VDWAIASWYSFPDGDLLKKPFAKCGLPVDRAYNFSVLYENRYVKMADKRIADNAAKSSSSSRTSVDAQVVKQASTVAELPSEVLHFLTSNKRADDQDFVRDVDSRHVKSAVQSLLKKNLPVFVPALKQFYRNLEKFKEKHFPTGKVAPFDPLPPGSLADLQETVPDLMQTFEVVAATPYAGSKKRLRRSSQDEVDGSGDEMIEVTRTDGDNLHDGEAVLRILHEKTQKQIEIRENKKRKSLEREERQQRKRRKIQEKTADDEMLSKFAVEENVISASTGGDEVPSSKQLKVEDLRKIAAKVDLDVVGRSRSEIRASVIAKVKCLLLDRADT